MAAVIISTNDFLYKKMHLLDGMHILKTQSPPPLSSTSTSTCNEIHIDEQLFRTLIVWIEEEKIRLYEPKNRGGLRDINNSIWNKCLENYLEELGVAVTNAENKNMVVLDKLTNIALQDVYLDLIQDGKVCTSTQLQLISSYSKNDNNKNDNNVDDDNCNTSISSDSVYNDNHPVVLGLNEILENFKLPRLQSANGAITFKIVVSAIRCIVRRLGVDCTGSAYSPKLKDIDPGIDGIEDGMREMAAILRLLHGNEIREIQSHINNVISKLQTFTADPKTDITIGKVGT